MKKVYLGLAALLVGTGAFAQQNVSVGIAKNKEIAPAKINKTANFEKADLWSNDFSTPGQWTISNNVGNSDNWVIGTGVPSGAYAIDGIESTTAANGFALFDSDLLCSGNQNADVYYSTPIDLTGYPNVKVTFESMYRRFQGNCYVIASTDGTTWTQVQVHTTIAVNGTTANPAITSADVSAIVGGSSTAYIGFRYIGGCDYAWMVDDVKIQTVDDYDLEAVGLYWGSEGAWGVRMPYYQVPNDQVTDIFFSGVVKNAGVMDITDVNFAVANGHTSASAPGTLNSGATDTFDVAAEFATPSTNNNYTFDFTLSTPGNTEPNLVNNAYTSTTVSVNDFIYARDMGTLVGGSFNQGEGFEVGNVFDIVNATDIYGVDVVINGNTNVGAQIFAKLYAIGETELTQYMGESDIYTVTNADLGNKVTLPLLEAPFALDANTPYIVVVGTYGDGGATDDLVVGTSGQSSPTQEEQNSYYYDATDQTWYYTTATPMVRMNFNPSLSINSVSELEGVKVYPNPSEGIINITNDLNVENTIVVTDVTGKIVASTVASSATTLNLSNAGTGIYLVTIANANGKKVERVVIK